jgi:GH35 family endo-1,4-beta-xylanase
MMYRWATVLVLVGTFAWDPVQAKDALVIRAEKADIRTEGGPNPGGGWNLWSDGRVGQPLRFATTGIYRIVVRAWGSQAGGVWPEMALLVDGKAVKTVTVNRAEREDNCFDVELAAGAHEIAVGFLNDALVGKEDRNLYLERFTISPPSGAVAPELVDKQELAQAAEKREWEVVAATQAAIEKHRKVDATIRVLDAGGQPVPGAKVSLEQTSHDFLFGCNIYMFDRYRSEAQNAAYKQRFQGLFNYATVGFYWRWYEPQRGQPNYEYTDKVVGWCRERGIHMKGHPLLWGDEAGVPRWSEGQPSPEIQRQRVAEIMQRYRGKIEFWEVVNEPSHVSEPKIDGPYRWARETNPSDCLIVNDYYVLADGGPGFFRLLTNAIQQGVPFDGIGIQAHEPRTMRFPLDRVQKILDQYATFGKGLHITEYTPTSSGQKITGSHREGVWDEAAQADYAVKFYRVCFAHPAMRAITWWDLCDQGSWLPGGGMLRADMSPKPVYEQLQRLIHEEWRTSASGTTDTAGGYSCRGFLGKYRLVVQMPDRKVEQEVRLAKDGPPEIMVRLSASPTK